MYKPSNTSAGGGQPCHYMTQNVNVPAEPSLFELLSGASNKMAALERDRQAKLAVKRREYQ